MLTLELCPICAGDLACSLLDNFMTLLAGLVCAAIVYYYSKLICLALSSSYLVSTAYVHFSTF